MRWRWPPWCESPSQGGPIVSSYCLTKAGADSAWKDFKPEGRVLFHTLWFSSPQEDQVASVPQTLPFSWTRNWTWVQSLVPSLRAFWTQPESDIMALGTFSNENHSLNMSVVLHLIKFNQRENDPLATNLPHLLKPLSCLKVLYWWLM